jgi:large subunit ribosomal protein L29
MKIPKISQFDNLNITELEEEIISTKKKIFQLRVDKSIYKNSSNIIKYNKHRLCHLLTMRTKKTFKIEN